MHMPPFLSGNKGANNSDSWKTMWNWLGTASNFELGIVELGLMDTVGGHFAQRRANCSASEGSRPDLASPNSSWSCSSH